MLHYGACRLGRDISKRTTASAGLRACLLIMYWSVEGDCIGKEARYFSFLCITSKKCEARSEPVHSQHCRLRNNRHNLIPNSSHLTSQFLARRGLKPKGSNNGVYNHVCSPQDCTQRFQCHQPSVLSQGTAELLPTSSIKIPPVIFHPHLLRR